MKISSLFTSLFASLFLIVSVRAQTVYYVAPGGSDQHPGTREKPLGSVEKALSLVSSAPQGEVKLVLRKGIHYLVKPLQISAAELNGHILTIMGEEGEQVVISSARAIRPKWRSGKGKVLQAYIGKYLGVDQLFCNGRALAMARYPNIDSSARFFHGSSADALSKTRIRSWKNPAGGYVHALHYAEWGDFHYRITGKYGEDSVLLEGGWQNNRPAPLHEEYRFVENIVEELDAEGEWYYDRKSGMLSLIAPAGIDPAKAQFEISQLDNLITIKGDSSNPAQHVKIHNLHFTGTNRTFMHDREPLLRSDWTINRNGAILVEGAKDIEITNCTFRELGGHAIFVSRYNRNIQLRHNLIEFIGGNAIAFVGDPAAVRSPLFRYEQTQTVEEMDLEPGPKSSNYPAECLVYDNLIHDIGRIEKQIAAVQISMAMDIRVSHNTIYNVPRAGINIGDGCWGGHLIEYNDVFNTVLETGDHGAFNSWGRDRYWLPSVEAVDSVVARYPQLPFLDMIKPVVIRNNRFHCEHGWDIDLDDGSSNYEIYNNVCLNGGLKLREGYKRKVTNNIILNNTFHPHVWFKKSQDIFKHNILFSSYAAVRIRDWGSEVDSNLFVQPGALEEVRKFGTDRHSVAGDPAFVNPLAGDFRVQAGSPAERIGFKPFSGSEFGVVSVTLKSRALRPQINLMAVQSVAVGQSIEWLGAMLKNIETLGEQSASGAPDRKGVLIQSVARGSLAEKNGLAAGDVIRSVNETAINDLNHFLSEVQKMNWKGEIEAAILHNQQLVKKALRLK